MKPNFVEMNQNCYLLSINCETKRADCLTQERPPVQQVFLQLHFYSHGKAFCIHLYSVRCLQAKQQLHYFCAIRTSWLLAHKTVMGEL